MTPALAAFHEPAPRSLSDDRPDHDVMCVCGSDMEWIECPDCAGEGYHDDLYEQDPTWYGPDDIEECETCQGKGGWYRCYSLPALPA